MGTEILHPQDCLIQRLRSVPTIIPRRKPHPNPRPCRRQAKRSPPPPDSHLRKASPEEQAPRPGRNLVAGQVTILKRGESLDSKRSSIEFGRTDLRKAVSLNEADLFVCGTGRLGPDPELVPKQIRLKDASLLRSDVYAGSAFSQSPSPSSLPLPSFSTRKTAAAVEDSATKDLRRLLRLD